MDRVKRRPTFLSQAQRLALAVLRIHAMVLLMAGASLSLCEAMSYHFDRLPGLSLVTLYGLLSLVLWSRSREIDAEEEMPAIGRQSAVSRRRRPRTSGVHAFSGDTGWRDRL